MAERGSGEQKSAAMRIKLKYPDVETFLAKYGPNISRGGIFIATKSLRPVGTALRFDFVLLRGESEESVLRGEGTVHFVREVDPAMPTRAAGMGVRFTRLFDDGQALVDRALQLRGTQGDPPSAPDLPRGVREVTGEVELGTVQIPLEDPDPDAALPPPRPLPTAAVPAATAGADSDLEALAREAGISTERIDAILGQRGHRGIDTNRSAAELESLREEDAPEATSAVEATARLDALLSRRRR